MKKMIKFIAGLLLSACVVTTAVAGSIEPPRYGLTAAAAKSTSNQTVSYVYLNNKTYDQFYVDAYYPVANVLFKDYYLGPYQSSSMTLLFTVYYPDSACLTLTRLSDGSRWDYGCFTSGSWDVRYNLLNAKTSLDKPTISKS